ncbi:hypothetical protein N7517_010494 [Penicillium concentricum]|uniref:Rhodopsin domain-containing protein n=1 Tax=Penicillium concentricum TaxID=293559 RepID=A0A9W9UUG7_9EURO|nr:uncharacterized protein N7517_010494 [Penicillium concentricum]KAJ5355885.1 hypothetical protein N7517_010494 [Penicillium concentricum]
METFRPRSDIEDRGSRLLIINCTVTGFAAIIVVLRTISRIFIVKIVGPDDWIMMAATIFAALNVVVDGFGTSFAPFMMIPSLMSQAWIRKHKWDLTEADLFPAAKVRYVTHIIDTLVSGLIKVSICLLYLRVFPNIRVISLGTIAFVTAMSVAIMLAIIFQCSPIDAVFDEQKYEHYTCFESVPFWYLSPALSLVMDVWILLLPLKTVLGLQLETRKRFVVAGLLSLGSFACIASIIRMVHIVKMYQSPDPSWDTFGISIWSGIELAVAIIAASIPPTKPIMSRLFPRLFSSSVVSQSTSHRAYSPGSRVESPRGRYQPRDVIPLSPFTTREGSDMGDDESTITHANRP